MVTDCLWIGTAGNGHSCMVTNVPGTIGGLSGDCQRTVHGCRGQFGQEMMGMEYANEYADSPVDYSGTVQGLFPDSERNQDTFSSSCRILPKHSPEFIYLFIYSLFIYFMYSIFFLFQEIH